MVLSIINMCIMSNCTKNLRIVDAYRIAAWNLMWQFGGFQENHQIKTHHI